jgi:hypothetical protein
LEPFLPIGNRGLNPAMGHFTPCILGDNAGLLALFAGAFVFLFSFLNAERNSQ